MEPYGRIAKIKGGKSWKLGIKNAWWEDIVDTADRGRLNQIVRKQVLEEIHEDEKDNILPWNISFHL